MLPPPDIIENEMMPPLNSFEQDNLRSLLDTVDTYTLLLSLLRIDGKSTDGRLLIAAILDRLPPESGDR